MMSFIYLINLETKYFVINLFYKLKNKRGGFKVKILKEENSAFQRK